MKKSILSLVAGAVLMAAALPSMAQEVPTPLKLAAQGGLKIERSFKAEGGLTGWILSEGPGRNMVVYTSADGNVAIAGTMLNAKGENLSAKYADQYGTKVDYGKYWSRLEKSAYVAEGAKNPKSVIYVFKDANCGYCHQAWRAFQPYEKSGLQIRWVMVSFLSADSANKAAFVMNAKDPDAAMSELHENFGKKSALSSTPVSADIRAKLEANGKLMQEMGFRGTPATLYKDKSGKVQAVEGMPRPAQIAAITGVPAQAEE